MLPLPYPLRILVVDDNRDAADTLTELLSLIGADVRTCYGGAEALEMVAGGFDLDAGVLDLDMPGMNGMELAGRLRAAVAPRHVVLIALSGVGKASARGRTAEGGFDLHLDKGSDPEELVAALVVLAGPGRVGA